MSDFVRRRTFDLHVVMFVTIKNKTCRFACICEPCRFHRGRATSLKAIDFIRHKQVKHIVVSVCGIVEPVSAVLNRHVLILKRRVLWHLVVAGWRILELDEGAAVAAVGGGAVGVGKKAAVDGEDGRRDGGADAGEAGDGLAGGADGQEVVGDGAQDVGGHAGDCSGNAVVLPENNDGIIGREVGGRVDEELGFGVGGKGRGGQEDGAAPGLHVVLLDVDALPGDEGFGLAGDGRGDVAQEVGVAGMTADAGRGFMARACIGAEGFHRTR